MLGRIPICSAWRWLNWLCIVTQVCSYFNSSYYSLNGRLSRGHYGDIHIRIIPVSHEHTVITGLNSFPSRLYRRTDLLRIIQHSRSNNCMYTTLKIQKLAFFFFSSVRLQMYSIKSKKSTKKKRKETWFSRGNYHVLGHSGAPNFSLAASFLCTSHHLRTEDSTFVLILGPARILSFSHSPPPPLSTSRVQFLSFFPSLF
jgi:hypothetical protein